MPRFGYRLACNLNYLDEFLSDHETVLYNELIKEKQDPTGNSIKVKPKPKTVNMFLQVVKAFFREELIKGHLKETLSHI